MAADNKVVVGLWQEVYSVDMEPNRPLSEDEIRRTLAERDKTFDRDQREAEPWQTAKADLLRSLKHPAPR